MEIFRDYLLSNSIKWLHYDYPYYCIKSMIIEVYFSTQNTLFPIFLTNFFDRNTFFKYNILIYSFFMNSSNLRQPLKIAFWSNYNKTKGFNFVCFALSKKITVIKLKLFYKRNSSLFFLALYFDAKIKCFSFYFIKILIFRGYL